MESAGSFADWLKQRRKALDLTQDALAERADCSTETVRKIEGGRLRPSRQLAELLAAGLEIAPEERPAFVGWARTVELRSDAAAPPPSPSPAAIPAPESGRATGPAALDPPNPYKGLRAFQEADAPDFFGRAVLTARLCARLAEDGALARFLGVVGPSGAGKSSIVRAGLLPALRGGALPGDLPVIVDLIPGTHPFEELEAALLRVAVNPPPSLMEQLRTDERGLARAVKRVLPAGDRSELLLVIDQFEELFTLVADERVRADFLDSLFSAVTDPRSRLRVVITLRADFYDRPLRYLPTSALLAERTEVVGPLTSDEMHEAITGPAHRAGLELESGLVATIMQDVAEQPGTLPLLQYALTELYERRSGHLLTLAAYRDSGGVFGALARRAETVYAGLTAAEQGEARQLFLRLVTLGEGAEDTRRRVLRAEVQSAARVPAALERALDVYGRYRMLTFDRDPLTQGPTVELAHEALLRTWGRLGDWLRESRERLQVQRRLLASAGEWQAAGQDASFLASGVRLAQFAALAADADQPGGVALTAEERAYLVASQAEEQRRAAAEQAQVTRELGLQKRATARLRYLVGALALFLLAASALAAWALSQSQVAQANEQIARANLAHAAAQRLAAEANSLLLAHGDSALIGLLSIRSINAEYSPQADAALSSAAAAGLPPRPFIAHWWYLTGVAFSPDGKLLLTASADLTARLWDAAAARPLRVLTGHTYVLNGAVFSPDGKTVLTGSLDHTARLWDTATARQVGQLTDSGEIYGLAWAPDGRSILTGGQDGTVHLWDVVTARPVLTFTGHAGPVFAVAVSPDGQQVLTGGADHTVRLWDAAGHALHVFSGHTDFVNAVAFAPDGKTAASASFDHTVRLWDLASGTLLRVIPAHQAHANAVAFSPDGRDLLTGGDDKSARLWEVVSGRLLHIYYDVGAVNGVAFAPDGKSVATAGGDNVARIWPLQTVPGEPQFVGHTGGVWQATFSPDGRRVLTAGADKTARLWDAVTGQELLRFSGHQDEVRSAAFSPDGAYVVTAGADTTVRLWPVAGGAVLRQFAGHTALVSQVVFSPDSKTVATASFDGTVRTWDAGSGNPIATFRGHAPAHVNAVAFAPDGTKVVTGGDDQTARLWDPRTGRQLAVLAGHTDVVTAVAFSPDGLTVLTASADGTARLWAAAGGQEVRRFAGHGGALTSAAFAPDGKTVLTGGAGQIAQLWDAATGAEVRRFSGHTGPVWSVAFSPDGQFILTASDDQTARLWHTDYHATIGYLCGLLPRDLTPDERARYDIADARPTCPGP